MRIKNKVRVNPRKDKDGMIYNAYDHIGRKIAWKEQGTVVIKNIIVSRQLKTGDLIIVEESKEEMKKEIKTKKEMKTKNTDLIMNKEVIK